MSDLEKRAILALQDVRFPMEGWYERRARALWFRMQRGERARLLVTEAGDLWLMVWKFRRQIRDEAVVAHADELLNKARRLVFDLEPSLAKG